MGRVDFLTMFPGQSLLLKALLPCAAECSWFHAEERRVKSSMDVSSSEGSRSELHLSGSLLGTWVRGYKERPGFPFTVQTHNRRLGMDILGLV